MQQRFAIVLTMTYAALMFFPAHLALADEARDSTTHHEFNHKLEYAKADYQSPTQECFSNGIRGALIGLGTGAAYGLVSYGVTGKGNPNTARVMSTTTGLGFIAGAIYGYISAQNENDRIRAREDRLLQKYGTLAPAVFTGSSLASTGYGFSYSLAL